MAKAAEKISAFMEEREAAMRRERELEDRYQEGIKEGLRLAMEAVEQEDPGQDDGFYEAVELICAEFKFDTGDIKTRANTRQGYCRNLARQIRLRIEKELAGKTPGAEEAPGKAPKADRGTREKAGSGLSPEDFGIEPNEPDDDDEEPAFGVPATGEGGFAEEYDPFGDD